MACRLGIMLSRCQRIIAPGQSSSLPYQIKSLRQHQLDTCHYRTISTRSWIGKMQTTSTTTAKPPAAAAAPGAPPTTSTLESSSDPSVAPPSSTDTESDSKPTGSRMSIYRANAIKYGKDMLNEYKTVLIEAYDDGISHPGRTTCYLLLLGGIIYLIWSNPTEDSFHSEFTVTREEFDLVGEAVRSPKSEQYIRALSRLHNRGELRYTDLVLLSVVWRHDHDQQLAIYESQCKYLKPAWSEMWDRLIDVGIGGRWWISRRVMQDYDVNEWEWEPKISTNETSAQINA